MTTDHRCIGLAVGSLIKFKIKMKKSNKIRSIIMLAVVMLVCFFPYLAMAQPPDPPPNPDAPIDGGLILLLAVGVGYGVKKYRGGRKKNLL